MVNANAGAGGAPDPAVVLESDQPWAVGFPPSQYYDPFSAHPQSQSVRTHMGASNVYFNVDEGGLRAVVPVAEWFNVLRQLRTLTPVTFIDTTNSTVVFFRPYLAHGIFEVSVSLTPAAAGPRLKYLLGLKN